MLAIVIPYYKLTFFEETLQSLANQTDKRFKVYIGDDASPDTTEQVARKWEIKDPRFIYLYKESDNEPLGIILCASKNESLVKYATIGLSQQVFVSKYLVNLPKEEELKKIIREEQYKINQTNLK